eukprot:scaffold120021_cov32-Tisochrysis_lutea.AAC.2
MADDWRRRRLACRLPPHDAQKGHTRRNTWVSGKQKSAFLDLSSDLRDGDLRRHPFPTAGQLRAICSRIIRLLLSMVGARRAGETTTRRHQLLRSGGTSLPVPRCVLISLAPPSLAHPVRTLEALCEPLAGDVRMSLEGLLALVVMQTARNERAAL